MDGGAYHAACGLCICIGIVCACVILVDCNIGSYTDAGRGDVRYGTDLETIRLQTRDDAPEGYPCGRTGAIPRDAVGGMVSVPTAQSPSRTGIGRDTRGMLSWWNGKQRDMLSCKGRHCVERSHDGCIHAPCPNSNPCACASVGRKGSKRGCHGNVPEYRAGCYRAYHSRLRGKPLLWKVHGEDNAIAANGFNHSHRPYHRYYS